MPALHEAIGRLLAEPQLQALAALLILITARLLPLFALTPIFGGQQVPARFRLAAAVALSAGLWAALTPLATPALLLGFPLLLAKELLIGTVLAIAVSVVMHIFSAAGALFDQLRGDQALTVFDPHVQRSESPTGLFFLQLAVMLFFTLGGHRVLLLGVARSYVLAPPETPLGERLGGISLADASVFLLSELIVIALQICGPVLIATLSADVAIALLSRVAQRIDVSVVGFGVRGGVAVGAMLISLGAVIAVMRAELARLFDFLALALGGEWAHGE